MCTDTSDSATDVFDFEECSCKQFGTLLSKNPLHTCVGWGEGFKEMEGNYGRLLFHCGIYSLFIFASAV